MNYFFFSHQETLVTLKKAISNGEWVILQNCHLSTQIMEKVGQLLADSVNVIHPEFRLWVIALDESKLPFNIIHQAIKGKYNMNVSYKTHV